MIAHSPIAAPPETRCYSFDVLSLFRPHTSIEFTSKELPLLDRIGRRKIVNGDISAALDVGPSDTNNGRFTIVLSLTHKSSSSATLTTSTQTSSLIDLAGTTEIRMYASQTLRSPHSQLRHTPASRL